MRRLLYTIGAAVLFAVGAAAAATVSGSSLFQVTTTLVTTTVATATATTATTQTTTVVTPPPLPPRRMTICHHTGSRRNPHHTIRVTARLARIHMRRHGDTRFSCTSALNLDRHSRPAHVRRYHPHTTLRAEVRREQRRGR